MATNIGIKASGTNDVLTATPAQLAFSSAYRHPKIWQSGKISGTSQTLNNPFGYPLRHGGYILNTGKYFLNYDRKFPQTQFGFENTNYGFIKADNSNLYLTADVANSLVYVALVDPAIDAPSSPLSITKGNIGMKFTKTDDDVLTVADYLKSLTTEFKMLKIVQEGDVTLTAQGFFTPAGTSVEKTDFTDVTHTLGYAGHIIVFDEVGKSSFSYLPIAIGGTLFTETEVYVDTAKIRFRVSRVNNAIFFDETAAARDVTFHYFLTDYRLPS